MIYILHALDTLINEKTTESTTGSLITKSLISILCISFHSLHSIIAQRALQFFLNTSFIKIVSKKPNYMKQLYTSLMSSHLHWNQTVNKMRYNALMILKKQCINDQIVWNQLQVGHFKQKEGNSYNETDIDQYSHQFYQSLYSNYQEEEEEEEHTHTSSNNDYYMLKLPLDLPFDSLKVTYRQFVYGHCIGQGAYGDVYSCQYINRQLLPSLWPIYAVKIVNKDVLKEQEKESALIYEISIMKQLKQALYINQYIVQFENKTN